MNDHRPDQVRDTIRCYVNGKRHEIRGADAFLPLTTWLRDVQGLTGTKVVCAEGDCGACCVLLGKPGASGMSYRPVCGCIQYMFQLDLSHLVTVEGLSVAGAPNPVQEAMITCHGAQCGFCTPGIVVALYGLLTENPKATDDQIRRGLVGNLCRCTGYEPILRAASEADRRKILPLPTIYEEQKILADLACYAGEAVEIRNGGQVIHKPATLEDAIAYRGRNPGCLVVAGGTDLGVRVNKGMRAFDHVLYIADLHELTQLSLDDQSMIVGGAVSLSDLETATRTTLPEFAQLLDWFGSPPIRNAGTLGGNIVNGSPIGDTMPGLMVLGAEVELRGPRGVRWVDLNAFYTGYRQSVLRPDELLTRVRIPVPHASEYFRVYKVSKRKDLDISTFMAAFLVRLEAGVVEEIRVAYGGVGPTIVRLCATEARLRGRHWDES
ncbi:MAG TPA: FAD binding domain-containing protein, partial [Pirellulaceae bacterium]